MKVFEWFFNILLYIFAGGLGLGFGIVLNICMGGLVDWIFGFEDGEET